MIFFQMNFFQPQFFFDLKKKWTRKNLTFEKIVILEQILFLEKFLTFEKILSLKIFEFVRIYIRNSI